MVSKSQLKYIQSLGQKKHRDEEGVFIAEGPKLVQELLQNRNVELKSLYALSEWIEENEKLLREVNMVTVNETELERMSQLKTPNSVVAIVKKFEVKEPEVKGKISLVLDNIQDPGNLGTIIRTADWFGVSEVVCSPECADVYNPKVIQATMGSIARVNVFYTDLSTWLSEQNHIKIYAAVLDGKNITEISTVKEGLIVIGNESKGIHEQLLQLANEKITISKKGKTESLNAAVAAGIILSWIV